MPALPRLRAAALAAESLIVTYPLVLMDLVRQQLTTTSRSGPLQAPANRFAHQPEFARTSIAPILTPTVDTLTSSAWLDLRTEPLVLSVPDLAGRFYAMPLYDAWTTVMAAIGPRTTGPRARRCVVVGPRWRGSLPRGLPVLQSPTTTAWVLAHIQCDGEGDYPAVNRLQAGLRVTPLSLWGGDAPDVPAPADPPHPVASSPAARLARMDPEEYFGAVARLLPDNPPHGADRARVERMAALGVVPGREPEWTMGDRPLVREIARGMAEGLAQVEAAGNALSAPQAAWISPQDVGRRRADPLARAAKAWTALGMLPREDGLVFTTRSDSTLRPLSGECRYLLRFPRGEAPPARAFWSLTAYDEIGFFAPDADRSPALSDRDGLRYERDGSLVILLSHDRPEGGDPNWLPTPAGPFSLALRLYWPQPSALHGTWRPAPVAALESACGAELADSGSAAVVDDASGRPV